MVAALFLLLLAIFIIILNIRAAIKRRIGNPRTVIEPRITSLDRASVCAALEKSAKLAHNTVADIASNPSLTTLHPLKNPLFIDCETTGLHSTDGIITLALVLLNLDDCSISCRHFIFDPLCKSHPEAEAIHRIDDWIIRHQPLFGEHIQEIDDIIRRADGIVCHNAAFDMSFLARSYEKYGMSLPELPIDCTMVEARHRGELASLAKCAARIGLKRTGDAHGAMEDAMLCLRVWLSYRNIQISGLPEKPSQSFSNLNNVPERPKTLPRRANKAKWVRYCTARAQEETITRG